MTDQYLLMRTSLHTLHQLKQQCAKKFEFYLSIRLLNILLIKCCMIQWHVCFGQFDNDNVGCECLAQLVWVGGF